MPSARLCKMLSMGTPVPDARAVSMDFCPTSIFCAQISMKRVAIEDDIVILFLIQVQF